jgi:aminopeptidase N
MKKTLFLVTLLVSTIFVFAQEKGDTSWKNIYRESAPRINDLVHTKIDIKPDFNKTWLYGKVWITLKPHFYPTDTLNLDAKGMDIKKLALVKGNQQVPLKFEYDEFNLRVKLDRTYKANENYTIYIEYIAKPDEFEKKIYRVYSKA